MNQKDLAPEQDSSAQADATPVGSFFSRPSAVSSLEGDLPLSEALIYMFDFGQLARRVGQEMVGWHRHAILSATDWATHLGSAAVAPLTSAMATSPGKAPRKKVLFRAITIPRNAIAPDRDSLLLVAQAATVRQDELRDLIVRQSARLHTHALPKELLRQARDNLKTLLIKESANARYRHRIGSAELSAGDIVTIAEPDADGRIATTRPWVVISSDLWLELLAHAHDQAIHIGGLIRRLVFVAPLFDFEASSNDLVVEIRRSVPGLPSGGHCAFHLFQTKSTDRMQRIEGPLPENLLQDIAAGLAAFLGFHKD